ncbi:MAG: ABC transporter ATP-binding protein [Gammaproteobacteria bacterium]|nr:ABC transporter ATP-binding protein [Gammaproteobacteria bacterium]NNM01036.1 ABC transporter ATP-binding protein [Gammaproteobacteria bacterium]
MASTPAHEPAGPAAIEVLSLHKSFGDVAALAEVSLTVAAGACVGLIGANGAGKTTLIKCLLDFNRAERGEVRIGGRDNRDAGARRGVAYLPERFHPPGFATGRQYLRYMLQLAGSFYLEADVVAGLEAFELEPGVLDRPLRQCSKGMAQKLGLAACFMTGARVYVLDEPMSGLDPRARAVLKQHIRAAAGNGAGVLFSTHLLGDVDACCDRLAVLHRGRLRYEGTPEDFRARYAAADLEAAYIACTDPAAG